MRFNAIVGEVMRTNIKYVAPEDSIDKAAQIMRAHKIGSVVVKDKNVHGILTTSDIVYKHVAEKKGPSARDIMTTDLITVSPNMSIEDAARLMVKKSVEKLLVFNKGSVVGIITNNDIIRIEPALFEILLERIKMGGTPPSDMSDYAQCESCNNYSDSVEEVDGKYACSDCRD